jgi:hypothetical protein
MKKFVLIFVLLAAVYFLVIAPQKKDEEENGGVGDINGDGVVDGKDNILLQNIQKKTTLNYSSGANGISASDNYSQYLTTLGKYKYQNINGLYYGVRNTNESKVDYYLSELEEDMNEAKIFGSHWSVEPVFENMANNWQCGEIYSFETAYNNRYPKRKKFYDHIRSENWGLNLKSSNKTKINGFVNNVIAKMDKAHKGADY